MVEYNYKALNALVNEKYPGHQLLKLKMPGLRSSEEKILNYYPITHEDDNLHVWITKENDAFSVDLKYEDYINATLNI